MFTKWNNSNIIAKIETDQVDFVTALISVHTIVFASVTLIVLCQQQVLAVILWISPLPTPSNAGEAAVHTGQEYQQFEHYHHSRHHQTEHIGWRRVPFVVTG